MKPEFDWRGCNAVESTAQSRLSERSRQVSEARDYLSGFAAAWRIERIELELVSALVTAGHDVARIGTGCWQVSR